MIWSKMSIMPKTVHWPDSTARETKALWVSEGEVPGAGSHGICMDAVDILGKLIYFQDFLSL